MQNEIIGLSVVSGLGIELKKIFPDITWYRESIINLVFPHFFVFQVTVDASEERKNYWWINYLINIRYRQVPDPTAVTTIQQSLDTVGLKLLAELKHFYIGDALVRIKNPRYEKVDGVLQYFCNVTLLANKPKEEFIKMLQLEFKQEVS